MKGKWRSVRGSNPSGQIESLVISPEIERNEKRTWCRHKVSILALLFFKQALPPG